MKGQFSVLRVIVYIDFHMKSVDREKWKVIWIVTYKHNLLDT